MCEHGYYIRSNVDKTLDSCDFGVEHKLPFIVIYIV